MRGRVERASKRMREGTPRWLALGATLPLLSGCYTYTLVPVEQTPVGENVRLVVSRVGVPDLAGVDAGETVAPQVRGRVTGTEGRNLLVRVPLAGDLATGPSVLDVGQVVRVPMDEVLSSEIQRFSAARTGLLVAGGAAGAAFIIYAIIDGSRGDDPPDGPDPELFFRLMSIPIG